MVSEPKQKKNDAVWDPSNDVNDADYQGHACNLSPDKEQTEEQNFIIKEVETQFNLTNKSANTGY